MIAGYYERKAPPESPFDLYHRNGTKKTREELDNEALEENLAKWLGRYTSRPSFASELVNCIGAIFCIVKCFARLDIELGVNGEKLPFHPVFWIILLISAVFSIVYTSMVDSTAKLAGECGRAYRAELQATNRTTGGILDRIGSHLSVPLLSGDVPDTSQANGDGQAESANGDEEEPESAGRLDEGEIGTSDITSDAVHKANWTDLLAITYPDMHFIALAFVFLLLAAASQIMIPKYTGKILQALSDEFAGDNANKNRDISIFDVPGFLVNVKLLVISSVLCGLFSGIRGSVFTLVRKPY